MLTAAGSAESEDSLSDEFTLCVEEVIQTEEIPVDSSDVLMPKQSTVANADEPDVETVVDFDHDLNSVAPSETNTSSPGTISTASEFEVVGLAEETTLSTRTANSAECKATGTEDESKKTDEAEADDRPTTPEKKVDSGPVCNGDSTIRKISDDDSVSICTKENNVEVRLNGVLPYTHDSSVFNSCGALEKPLTPNSVREKPTPTRIAQGSFCNLSNNRKRSVDCSEVDASTFKSGCDTDIHLVSDIKKRKISDDALELNNITSNGFASSVEDTQDHQYAVSTLPKSANTVPSQGQSVTAAATDSPENVVIAKKNIARKHTTSMSISKTMKDVENTVLSELSKHEPHLTNGFIRPGDVSTKECPSRKDQSTNTESQYKVNLSVDSLSSNSLKNIFKSMRKTLTRRQLEEIVLQKVCEMISDSHEIGELKKQILELQQAETHRKLTCFNLEKQMHQLKGVCQVFIEKANAMKRDGKTCIPTMVTRSVGLQVSDPSPVSKVINTPSSTTTTITTTHQVRNVPAKPSGIPTSDEKKTVSSVAAVASTGHSSVNTSISNLSTIGRKSPSSEKSSNEGSSSSAPVEESSIIDLTDKEDKGEYVPNVKRLSASHISTQMPSTMKIVSGAGLKPLTVVRPLNRHPAPLPKPTIYPLKPGLPHPPPKPELSISRNNDGISLSWNMSLNPTFAKISRYQIYAYQETNSPAGNDPWKPVGEVNALPLPMECTLTQFYRGHRYHFTVRAVDDLKRTGPFSEPCSIAL